MNGNYRCKRCDCCRSEHGECPKCAGHEFVETMPLAVTYPPDGSPIPSYLRPHTPRPPVPTTKDTEIARIIASVDFDGGCVHDAETLTALVREAYEAGQRDPLPDPIGPSDNHLWSRED